MKKLFTISFLFVFLGINTELHQLLRLPVLLQHFWEHHEQEPDETFAEFLNEHYSRTQTHSHTDNHDHDNLPFNSTDCATAHVPIAFVNLIQYHITSPTVFQDKGSSIYNGVNYFSAFLSNIWQPPKFS